MERPLQSLVKDPILFKTNTQVNAVAQKISLSNLPVDLGHLGSRQNISKLSNALLWHVIREADTDDKKALLYDIFSPESDQRNVVSALQNYCHLSGNVLIHIFM